MDWIYGVSECYGLSRSCVIDWDAWASIGTMAGVLTALFGPAIRRRFVRRRVTAIFAAGYYQQVRIAKNAVADFVAEFPVGDQSEGIFKARMLLENSPAMRTAAQKYLERLNVLAAESVDLSKFPEVDTVLAADVSRSIFFVQDLARLIQALGGPHQQAETPDWKKYFDNLQTALTRTAETLGHAANGCQAALNRMSIKKALR